MSRVRTSDQEFFKVNEQVAKDPAIKTGHTKIVAQRLGLTEQSVQQRRCVFNRTFKEKGLVLTPFPKSGGRKKDIDAIASELLAMRDDAKEVEQTPSE